MLDPSPDYYMVGVQADLAETIVVDANKEYDKLEKMIVLTDEDETFPDMLIEEDKEDVIGNKELKCFVASIFGDIKVNGSEYSVYNSVSALNEIELGTKINVTCDLVYVSVGCDDALVQLVLKEVKVI